MWAALVAVLPLAVLTPYPADVPWVPTGLAVLGLGVLCSGVAYLIYFRLVSNFGGVTALSVTFLIPVFGTLWGVVFLGETVTWVTAAGGVLVLLGTAWVTGFSIKGLRGV